MQFRIEAIQHKQILTKVGELYHGPPTHTPTHTHTPPVQHKQILTKVGELPEGKAEMHPMKGAQLI